MVLERRAEQEFVARAVGIDSYWALNLQFLFSLKNPECSCSW
jgi:hypothetical protein